MCTNFILSSADGSFIVGRSMENSVPIESQFIIRGAGQKMAAPLPSDVKDATTEHWTVAYDYFGLNVNAKNQELNVLGTDWVADGMNAKGLSVAMQTLPETQLPPAISYMQNHLAFEWFCDWALGNFATVAEVQAELSRLYVWAPAGLGIEAQVHYSLFDSTGAGLVVEFVNGKPVAFNNTIGVCTNGPTFDWHLANVGNYTGLTALDAPTVQINGQTYVQAGHGSGLMGIPGDSTPPSRFIRTTYLKQLANTPKNAEDGVSLAFHLLNAVDIPLGCSIASKNTENAPDFTQYASVRDLTNLVYYVRFYDSPTPVMIDLKTLNIPSSNFQVTSLPKTAIAIDVTKHINTDEES